ncbi:ABC transporter ATP-binding protein [Halorhodospira halochloris]|uniref:ABC transporter ATP-binding protein n=1 Tax=Halorhodospira halochloris TaxID=1052 RepID=UPI001EE8DA8B|nr:ABC transporter ATP-binding protein [Halorhodospira halochloris]MCG5529929.1 ABC transporter ATP-binding protein [Halorhodospira halochloris]
MSLIHLNNVTKTHPGSSSPAIKEVSLSIESAEALGIIGANGAGKSTLLLVLMGVLSKDSGTIVVDGSDIDITPKLVRSHFGFVPQTPAFYPTLSVYENLHFFTSAHGLSGTKQRRDISRVLSFSDLDKWQTTQAARLSGGLKKRLNLAIGLINNPNIICMDEPTAGVDPQTRNFILNAISHLVQNDHTVIYTSHYMNEIESVCNRIAVFDNGDVIATGTLAELHSQHIQEIRICTTSEPNHEQIETFKQLFPGLSINNNTLTIAAEELTSFDSNVADALIDILTLIKKHKLQVKSINYGQHGLKDLYLNVINSHKV